MIGDCDRLQTCHCGVGSRPKPIDLVPTTDLLKVLVSQLLNLIVWVFGVVWSGHVGEVIKGSLGAVPRNYNWRWHTPPEQGQFFVSLEESAMSPSTVSKI